MIVMKFGGSSIESAAAIQNVVSIVRQQRLLRPIVVVSAMGKTTDRLLQLAHLAADGNMGLALSEARDLETFHQQHARALFDPAFAACVGVEITEHFQELISLLGEIAQLQELTPKHSDAALSFGERLSSKIVSAALTEAGVPSSHLDARRLVLTDDRHRQAAPLIWESYARLRRAIFPLVETCVPVMGGFLGATEQGVTTTLGRGGSDYSASLVGAAVMAEEVQIWTDVDGMLSGDPRVVTGGHCLREISYEGARDMARCGAKVLHPDTVEPAIRRRIVVTIRNSRRPQVPGTRIVAAVRDLPRCPKSVASRTGATLMLLQPSDGTALPVLLQEICGWLADQPAAAEVVVSERGLALLLDNSVVLADLMPRLLARASVSIERELAIVTLLGEWIDQDPALIRRAEKSIGQAGVLIQARSTALRRITFVVAERDLKLASAGLHQEFFADAHPELFWLAADQGKTGHPDLNPSEVFAVMGQAN